MKRVQKWIATVVLGIIMALFISLPASATEVITQLEGYWVQRNGDLVFYGSIVGPCIQRNDQRDLSYPKNTG